MMNLRELKSLIRENEVKAGKRLLQARRDFNQIIISGGDESLCSRLFVSIFEALGIYSNNEHVDEFLRYPIIDAIGDGVQKRSGIRGDGYCSIWAVLVGWSLLNRPRVIFHRKLLGRTWFEPKTLYDVSRVLIECCNILFLRMKPQTQIELHGMTFFEYEVNPSERTSLQSQLLRNTGTIDSQAQFKLLALLMGVEIHIALYGNDEVRVEKYNGGSGGVVRVSTDGCHYSVHARGSSVHMANDHWWREQWKGLYDEDAMPIPILTGKKVN